jgi:tetratricopeptide (TPR) repeat protein
LRTGTSRIWILRYRYRILLALLLLTLVGVLAVPAFPYLASAYHLEAGGRALDTPASALEHLHKAIEWDPNNAQAYRLLGRALRDQGDLPAAVEALMHYTQLRPDNPLGHIELAEVYEEAEVEMSSLYRADLVTLLPQAAVGTPDAPLDTPYSQPDGPVWHSYVAATTFSLPPRWGEPPTLFMHPSSRVTYTLALPPQPAALHFDMGMDPQTLNWPGDGATFEVFADGQRIFLEHLDKAMAREGWHQRTVDLAPWTGQELMLTLAVTPGPAADPTGDWAGWGEPQVADTRWFDLEALNPGIQVMEEWRRAGYTAEGFVNVGKAAQAAGRDEEAGEWYERALRLAPGWDEPYRLLGGTPKGNEMTLAYLSQGGAEAVQKANRLQPGNLYVNYQLWEQAQEAGDLVSAAAYRETLAYFPLEAIDPADEQLLDYAAEVIPALLEEGLWDRGKTLRVVSFLVWQHSRATGTERLLQQLVERYPGEPEWPFYLAELYHRRGDLDRAEPGYRQSLVVDPAYAQAYLRLGMVAEAKSRTSDPKPRERLEEAAWWYERYNEMAPDDLWGLKKVVELHQALDRPEAAAQREELAVRTDDRRVVAEMLGVPLESVELGPNLVENGGFEEWIGNVPKSWRFRAYLGQGEDKGLYAPGLDSLAGTGDTSRIEGLWGGLMDDGTSTYGEYEGTDFTLSSGNDYLISLWYRTQFPESGIGLIAVGEFSKSGGRLLTHTPLEDSSGRWHLVSVLVQGLSQDMSVGPLIRNWGLGDIWFDEVQVRPVYHRRRG